MRSVVRQIFTQWVEIFSAAAAFFLLLIYDKFHELWYECFVKYLVRTHIMFVYSEKTTEI